MSSLPAGTESIRRSVAPAWHTAVVLLAVFGFSFAGARTRNITPIAAAHGRTAGYILIILFEWAAVAFIWYGVTRHGASLREIIGGHWASPVAALRDFAIAVGFLIVSGVLLNGLGYLMKAVPDQALRNLIPRSPSEVAVYVILTLTAGFCEEIIFRGYLQRQFAALTDNAAGGIVLQAIAFAAGHAYQGRKYMLIIAAFGTLFGLLAHWHHSLRPGMFAHFLQDGAGGLLARHFLH